ncbi:MAG: hypothetical protein ACXWRE_11895 [Pseudobdellovibrionaceae bacterium]
MPALEFLTVATNYGGDSVTNNITPNVYTSTTNNSLGMGCATDWKNSGLPDSTDVKDVAGYSGAMSVLSLVKASVTPTSGSTVTLNFDAFSTAIPEWNWVAIEIKPAP